VARAVFATWVRVMTAQRKYPELRERAVKMVLS
jgi:hypothetical protein